MKLLIKNRYNLILQSNVLAPNQMLMFLVSSCFVKGKSDALTTLKMEYLLLAI